MYIQSFRLDVEQLLSLSPPRLAGREQIAKLVRKLSSVFQNVSGDARAAFLGGVSFVSRAYRVHLLFDQGIDRFVEPGVRRLSLAQFSCSDTVLRAFPDRRVE